MLSYAFPFTLAFAVSLCLTPVIRRLSTGRCPRHTHGRRRLHATSIPRLGGVAVFIAFYSCVLLASRLLNSPEAHEGSALAFALLLPSLVILILGIADDLGGVGPWIKIGVQLAAGLWVFYHLGIHIENVTNPFTGSSTLAALQPPGDAVLDSPGDKRFQHR